MADVKISGLPASTVPLAGTEVLPIVQGGQTRQVSINNLTAGKDVPALSVTAANLKTSTAATNLDISGATIAASGTDTNVPITLTPKGTGTVKTAARLAVGPSDSTVGLLDVSAASTGVTTRNILISNTSAQNSGVRIDLMTSGNSNRTAYIKALNPAVAGSGGPTELFFATNTDFANSVEQMKIGKTGDITAITGNLVMGTAAKGIDFSANTGAAGATKEILDWYEEGTWTPALEANGQVGSYTFTTQVGYYTRIGRTVYGAFHLSWSALPSVGAATRVIGLPFAWASGIPQFGATATYIIGVPRTDGLYMPMTTTGGGIRTAFNLFSDGSTQIVTTTGNNISATGTIYATFMYQV
jgi:hypothetical protein